MTTPCLLNNVETTLQTNLNTLNGKIKEIKGDLQQNLETCLQNISEAIYKVEENFLGPKGQAIQTTDSQASTETAEGHTIKSRAAQQNPEPEPEPEPEQIAHPLPDSYSSGETHDFI